MIKTWAEPDQKLDHLARDVIGAGIEVHRALGPGLLESVYEKAMCIELASRAIPCVPQALVPLYYKGKHVGEGRIDLLVDGQLVIELKAVSELADIHTAQLLTYLKTANFRLGLLMNFNVKRMGDGIKRVINT